jgi:ABC-type phosphate transport system permease subunit
MLVMKISTISSIIAGTLGVLLGVYLVSRVWKRRLEIRILRMAYVVLGAILGLFAWFFIVIPLAFMLTSPSDVLGGVIAILLLPVLMAIVAVIMDAVGKRRNYRPFMERGGNI